MMYSALLVAAAAVASAQYTYNSTTGVFTCPPDALNGAFCAGDSLQTNIIIRCNNGVGQPGNCDDNLDGYFPVGLNYAPCWQTSTTSGDAACSKNCIVEGGSGAYNGTFTLPNCTPSSSSSAAASTSTSSVSTTSSGSASTTSSSAAGPTVTSTTTLTTTTSCTTTTASGNITTHSSSFTTSILSPSGGSTAASNGTITTASTSATKTPTGPTTTTSGSSSFTGAANALGVNSGAGLAGIGLLIAYFL